MVPKIAPVEITFTNRTYVNKALVLGNEPLLGVIPLEAMDWVVDSNQQTLSFNLLRPNSLVALAK